jgi:5'-3' exonuclease
MASLDYGSPVLFIDLSYYIFYRYYALVNWYKLSQKDPFDAEALQENALFLEKFEKMFIEHYRKLRRKFKVVKDSNVVFARDCPRESVWRRAIYPEYKATRGTNVRDFNGYIFTYTYDVVIPKLVGGSGSASPSASMLSEATAEADDIIGTLVFKMRDSGHLTTPVFIVTDDMDYLQMVDARAAATTHIQNLRGADVVAKGHGDARVDVLYKIIVGDPSDNIKPVFSKCTKKAALEYAKDASALEAALAATAGARERFEFNRRLVDIRLVPDELKRKIEALII